MNNKVLVDSGPFIALFNKNDTYNVETLTFFKKNKLQIHTTLPVITEVIYVLDFNINAQSDFLEWISRGGVNIVNFEKNDFKRIKILMLQYKDRPMDFADASLVVACENLNCSYVLSVDSDFDIYRFKDKKHFKNLFSSS